MNIFEKKMVICIVSNLTGLQYLLIEIEIVWKMVGRLYEKACDLFINSWSLKWHNTIPVGVQQQRLNKTQRQQKLQR